MGRAGRLLCRACGALAAAVSCGPPAPLAAPASTAIAPADVVLRGGPVYTEDPARPRVEALAVRGDRVVFAGSSREAAAYVGPRTEVVELSGRSVIPGLHDAHVHPIMGGLDLARCQLSIAPAPKILAEARACAAARPRDAWLLGRGWGLGAFKDENPTREQLDAIEPARPSVFTSVDGHSAWLNSAALRAANITASTPDPPMGRVERDATSREPTGTLRDAAIALVRRVTPAPTKAELADAVARAVAMANGLGITSLFEANASQAYLEAYAEADRRGALTARVRVAMGIDVSTADTAGALAHFTSLRSKLATPRVRPEAIKIFADGVVGSHTAAMLEPYEDRPDERGTLLDAGLMKRLVKRYQDENFQIHVHAVGDAALRTALDAFEAGPPAGGRVAELRPIVAHLVFAAPADVARLAADGVIADLQPLWARQSRGLRLLAPEVGADRLHRRMPVAAFAKAGARLAAGSDWPVSSMDPFDAMEAAVTRRSKVDTNLEPENAEERIDLATALRAYTAGGAYAMVEERETGTLEVGKAADFAVLDRDLFAVADTAIHEVRVVSTWLAGRRVFPATR